MFRGRITKCVLAAALLFALAPWPIPGAAQGLFRVHIDYVDTSKFPQVDAYVAVSRANGEPIKDLALDAFAASEDGKTVVVEAEPLQNLQQPLGIALLIDTSSNFDSQEAPARLKKSIDAAKAFVEKLTPLDQIVLIKYANSATTVLPLTADKKAAGEAIDRLKLEGPQTAMYDAMYEGINAIKTLSGRRLMVLIGDGKDTGSRVFGTDAIAQAEDAAIAIYSVGLGNVIGIQTLNQMAALTGGGAYIDPPLYELEPLFVAALMNAREQYRVRYLSSLRADNTEHQLIVTVEYQGGKEQASAPFVSQSNPIPILLPGLQEGQAVGGMVDFTPVIDWPALNALEISVDGTLLKQISAPPFSYNWKSTDANLTPGPHTFTFKASDAAGNTGESNITLDVQPPISIKMNIPARGTTIQGPLQLVADVSALGNVAVQRVEFLVDDKLIDTITAPPYQTVWRISGYAPGPHVLSVVAYDASGLFEVKEVASVVLEPGFPWWMVIVAAAILAALIIPLAARSRRRRGTTAPVAVAAGMPLLREMEGLSPGQVWPLGTNLVRLGRKRAENDIPLMGLKASRRHATISFEQGRYLITSMSPDNPVLVNNAPIAQSQALQPGDLIRLGETTLRFEQ